MLSSTAKESIAPGFVEVALPLPLRRTFTYRLPADMQTVETGARLMVPFGKRVLTGYAVEFHADIAETGVDESAVKDVLELLDTEPLLTDEILRLTQWAADYYAASWGEMLKASLPAGINATVEKIYSLTGKSDAFRRSNAAAEAGALQKPARSKGETKALLLSHLAEHGEDTQKELEKKFGKTKFQRAARELAAEGRINITQRNVQARVKAKRRKAVRLIAAEIEDEKPLSEAQQRALDVITKSGGEILFTDLLTRADINASVINTLAKRGHLEVFVGEIFRDPLGGARLPALNDLTLTEAQAAVLEDVEQAVSLQRQTDSLPFKAFLLHGITGSGKTEVYIRAMRAALDQGKSALMLVPEIALTPIFSRRLRAVFGREVAILHSSLSSGERFDEWRRIRSGEARVVIGTRSAVFAPLHNLGMVIVDEEHDTSYRQSEAPFYHARDVAVMRANLAKAVVVLGSATPAMESYFNAKTGKYAYLQLPKRIADRPLAAAEVVDMREVFRRAGKDLVLSPELAATIDETHKKGEQSIILLNRRGFSQFVLCRTCGERLRCKNCDITLTFHRRDKKLLCHYCGFRADVPQVCPFCESEFLYFIGQGTEQIEDILKRKFPHLRIARIDRDTISRRKMLEKILLDFGGGEIDMLVGTQMLAKGHDFPNVTLVGVISVDIGLGLPDFRSAERTFQLLTQVAGRAGRGDAPGRVLIQTYYPEHYAIRHSVKQDYEGFYSEEIRYRERLAYPPFFVLASILIRHPDYKYAFDNAQILKECLMHANAADKSCRILGAAPASLSRLQGEHRLQILVKGINRKKLREVLDMALAEAEEKRCDLRIVFVEIDPVNML